MLAGERARRVAVRRAKIVIAPAEAMPVFRDRAVTHFQNQDPALPCRFPAPRVPAWSAFSPPPFTLVPPVL